ncbi:MerR family transcriptional regulator [Minwuia thermotolerans]|uniref:MerR family transcriptional regulator n=1 Tax=Minwuia thermotolerans TaxID=2056226 RepID=A0A2M9G521_9PROT|nr:helix-turn-helix domain-containing protein [Minwuia thermotolerans]PJK30815.1 MerR family transcriptional regulator [Minwuia thermotolerans]
MLSIGNLAERTGVKVPTIRYYEQMGLLDAPERSAGGQRRYTEAELERLAFIRHSRDLGLSIEAIRELLRLSRHPDAPCEDADRIATEHLAGVRARIVRLQRLEGELERMVAHCRNGTVGECRVIRALSDHELCAGEH